MMKMKSQEYILYGLDNNREIIDKIITDLDISNYYFDIKLILTEALTNAFKHGNNSNINKPIHLRYNFNGKSIEFQIEDSGTGFGNVMISDKISDKNILSDNGRGLFLINCIADKIKFNNKTLIIEKHLTNIRN